MSSEAKAAQEAHVDTRTGAPPPKPADPFELRKIVEHLESPFKDLAAFIGAAAAPVPNQTGDGSKLTPAKEASLLKKAEGRLKDFADLGIPNVKTLIEVAHEKMTGGTTDDKKYLMEGLIQTAATLADGSDLQKELTELLVGKLWNDLQHPPQSYLGEQYQYRTADGSFNSLKNPLIGAACTPYARTVKPAMMQTPVRPDPGVVFDSIMTRKHAELHPNRISSMLFYLASIIIHDCFRTSHVDMSISMTSSYLDLAPLYGSNQEEQDLMRTHVDGKIKPDCFSESRLLFFPPGVGAMLIMFNRFHNYTVENLALINEQGRFKKPVRMKKTGDATADEKEADRYDKAVKKYDNDLFQTGRLITCGLYVNIILIDYVRTILNLNQTDDNWQLNPRVDVKDLPVGLGNQVSAEFNLVYRWHSTVSARDEQWTIQMWEDMFGKGSDPKKISKKEFLDKLNEVYRRTSPDPSKRPFAGIHRNADGTLPDQELVDILTSSIDDCANSFGPNRVPAVFRAIEVLGIEQARAWNLGSLNEFRKYFNLKPHDSFESITKDTYVQDQLKHLYDHPDKVEIYPGIVVEDGKQPMAPGSGLCPSYTVSRAVLSDAVALVRGDRFYTHDYNPRTLTNWGYRLVDSDLAIDNGCVFYKLFLRAFPQHFKYNSVYAHYPLTTSSAMKDYLGNLNKAHLYDFAKPQHTPHPHFIREYKLGTEIMNDKETFKVTWGAAMEYIMGSHAKDFMLAGDGPKNADSRKMMKKALYVSDWQKEVRTYYAAKTRELLKKKSAKIADFNQVDIIRDVGNLAHVHFCAELFMLPLKTDDRPHGIFTEAELYLIMSGVFALIFFDVDPAGSFPLHLLAHKATQKLGEIVEGNVKALSTWWVPSSIIQLIWPHESALKSYGKHMIKRLLESKMDTKELVWGHLLGTAGGMVSNQGQLFAQIIEYYLLGAGNTHWPAIQALAQEDEDNEEAFNDLMHYMLEGGRLNGETGILRRVDKDTSITENGTTTPLAAGSTVFVSLRAVSHDPTIFPNPDSVDINRPIDAYVHLGHGPHQCLGQDMTQISLTTMLREVARLPGLKPAEGEQGKLHKVVQRMGPSQDQYPYHAYLTENWDMYFPFPCSLKVRWDDQGTKHGRPSDEGLEHALRKKARE